MAMKFVMRITFLLLLAVAYGLAEGAPPMANPNCRDSCGNVSIPYPFGIGSNCFMHKMYEIVCNENGVAAAAKAFLVLPSFRVEVLEIRISDPYNIDDDYSTEPGLIRVKMPITSSNCINKSSVAGINSFQSVATSRPQWLFLILWCLLAARRIAIIKS